MNCIQFLTCPEITCKTHHAAQRIREKKKKKEEEEEKKKNMMMMILIRFVDENPEKFVHTRLDNP